MKSIADVSLLLSAHKFSRSLFCVIKFSGTKVTLSQRRRKREVDTTARRVVSVVGWPWHAIKLEFRCINDAGRSRAAGTYRASVATR